MVHVPVQMNFEEREKHINNRTRGKPLSEKLYSLMEKDVETAVTARYNDIIPKECLAVGNLRRTAI